MPRTGGERLEDDSSLQHVRELHKKEEAQAVADRMGIRSIKRGDLCIQCHYTQQEVNGRAKAISGVSCESCHGAAADWMAIHNDYGGPDMTKDQEDHGKPHQPP